MEFMIGEIVQGKKNHPCGSKLWEIMKIGVNCKLKCKECGRIINVQREKMSKSFSKKA